MNKSLGIAILLALLLPMATMAEARPTSHSGTSGSFKSGFSSQKSKPSGSQPANFGSFGAGAAPSAPTAPASTFGSFGKQAADPAASAPAKSALSKNLDQAAAQDNALRTLDARKAAAAGTATSGGATAAPGNPGGAIPAPGLPPANAQYGGPLYPVQQPIIVQQHSGWGNMFMGFMLGRALSGGHTDTVHYVSTDASGSQQAAMAAPVPPQTSFFTGLLRFFAWMLILGGVFLLLRAWLRRVRRNQALRKPHYVFEGE